MASSQIKREEKFSIAGHLPSKVRLFSSHFP